MPDTDKSLNAETRERRDWMGLLARAPEAELMELWGAVTERPAFDWLRPPETGAVMVRGRAGATGSAFNLGEMTVTRCALALECGTVGHGYVQGRSRAKAEAAALIDAMMQTDAAEKLRSSVLVPLEARANGTRRDRAAKAAATKVDFFTMARGEDA
ncbi:phosphonate C-P lyase system protein PhnG [Lutimaribacter marinistellae]|uniref:Phosphonate C-P lyase system protein PhnG n=1 Tax=Lutimaribacter marinistellae TaxID=1820329 RepID=A0ABV7TFP9_9RHOB